MSNYIPNDIKNIIFKYKHNMCMCEVLQDLKKHILRKELSFEYTKEDINKILFILGDDYNIFVDYVELEKNIYSKVLILSIDTLERARIIENYFINNCIEHLGVGNYCNDNIKGLYIYDVVINKNEVS